MSNSIIRYSLFAVILIFLQVVLFNNIQFSGYVNPYVYVMILLLLPAVIPSWIFLIISFVIGLIIDLFAGSPGMHASATVMAGFTRPYVLRIISPRDGYESGTELSMASYGFRWFLLYTTIIVLIHHITLFYVEVFRLAEFFRTFLRVLLSSVFTIGFILLAESYRKRR
jgi:rod shape-determining protein MreD